ncbi:hypothetical protein BG011_005731 [Mortierella polycephala]|uniref:Uncharacterized protein n=1 Tax=Mortierella polycephala TaxID=41804 RepID=A0A9P6QCR9_9FUNG|nr:hypothetical protein BG011_005731 [Mortierella polycephala]
MIREEAAKERRRKCGQDDKEEEEEEEDEEEDGDEYDDDEEDTETKDKDSDEGSDDDDQGFDSTVLHESDDDDEDFQQYDIYENHDQQLHQGYKYQRADGSQYEYHDQRTTAETAPFLETLGLDNTKYLHEHPLFHSSDFTFNNTLHDSNSVNDSNSHITDNFTQDGTQQLSFIRHTIKDATSSMMEPATATEPALSFHFMPSTTDIATLTPVRTFGSDIIHEPGTSLSTIPERLTTYWEQLKQVPSSASPSPSPSTSTSSSSSTSIYYSCPSISDQ